MAKPHKSLDEFSKEYLHRQVVARNQQIMKLEDVINTLLAEIKRLEATIKRLSEQKEGK